MDKITHKNKPARTIGMQTTNGYIVDLCSILWKRNTEHTHSRRQTYLFIVQST